MAKRHRSDELQRFMSTPVLTLATSTPASDAWIEMHDERVRHAVVLRGKAVIGVISDRDLGGARGGRVRSCKSVGDMMHESPVTAKPTTTLRQAVAVMLEHGLGALPVVERGRLVGIVTRSDLLARLTHQNAVHRGRRNEAVARPSADSSPNQDKQP